MGKVKRKPKPSMPHWYWIGQDGCWFCEQRNNCNQCKANKNKAKEIRHNEIRKIKNSFTEND